MTSSRTELTVKQTLLEKRSAGQNPACSVFMSLQCLPVSDRLCLYVVPVGLHDPDALTQHHPHPPHYSPFSLLATNEYRKIPSSYLMTYFISTGLRLFSLSWCRWGAISQASQSMCSNIPKYLHGESPSMLEVSQEPPGSVLNPKDLLAVGHTCKVQAISWLMQTSGCQTVSYQRPLNWHKLPKTPISKEFCLQMFYYRKRVKPVTQKKSITSAIVLLMDSIIVKRNDSFFSLGTSGSPFRIPQYS